MQSKREQALVGLFVLIAAGVLMVTVFAISGAFGRSTKTYHAFFPFAGGLESGAQVRYSGGPKVALAPDGSSLASETYVDFNALTQQINDIAPHAQQLL